MSRKHHKIKANIKLAKICTPYNRQRVSVLNRYGVQINMEKSTVDKKAQVNRSIHKRRNTDGQ